MNTNTPSTLHPLKDRLNPYQMRKRNEKMSSRRTIAEHLQQKQRLMGNYIVGHIHMGFFARLKWLFFGAKAPVTTTNVVN